MSISLVPPSYLSVIQQIDSTMPNSLKKKDDHWEKLIEKLLPPLFYGEEVLLMNCYPPFEQIKFPCEMNKPEIQLTNKDLWKEFHKFGTEMILTNIGR